LAPGKMKLQTWLMADDGTSRGAYFVYVRRIPLHAGKVFARRLVRPWTR
jgi:hypothetical protein